MEYVTLIFEFVDILWKGLNFEVKFFVCVLTFSDFKGPTDSKLQPFYFMFFVEKAISDALIVFKLHEAMICGHFCGCFFDNWGRDSDCHNISEFREVLFDLFFGDGDG